MKILILYYTRSGNTKVVAETLAAALGADCEALQDDGNYAGATGYMRAGKDALIGHVATLQPLAHDPALYDLVILGQPVWAARPVPAIVGLLALHSLAGKKIALYVTYEGGGAKGCLSRTAQNMGPAEVVAQHAFLRVSKDRAAAQKRAEEWAAELKRDLRLS